MQQNSNAFDELVFYVKRFPSYLLGLALGLVIAFLNDPGVTVLVVGSALIGLATGSIIIGGASFLVLHSVLSVVGGALAHRNR